MGEHAIRESKQCIMREINYKKRVMHCLARANFRGWIEE